MNPQLDLSHLEVHFLVGASLVADLVLSVGVELLTSLERSGLGHHGEEGGVGGSEVLEQDHAGHHHQEEQQPSAQIAGLRL